MQKRIQDVMRICMLSVRHKLQRKVGFFDLLGFDFMVDADLQIYLIEINTNPALFLASKTLECLLPDMIDETLHIVLEIHEKAVARKGPVLPVGSQRSFVTIFAEEE